MEIKPGGDFDLGERTVKSVGDDAYSEISAIREELRRTRECLDLAVDTLLQLQQRFGLTSFNEIEQTLEKIRKGFYGSP